MPQWLFCRSIFIIFGHKPSMHINVDRFWINLNKNVITCCIEPADYPYYMFSIKFEFTKQKTNVLSMEIVNKIEWFIVCDRSMQTYWHNIPIFFLFFFECDLSMWFSLHLFKCSCGHIECINVRSFVHIVKNLWKMELVKKKNKTNGGPQGLL